MQHWNPRDEKDHYSYALIPCADIQGKAHGISRILHVPLARIQQFLLLAERLVMVKLIFQVRK